MALIYTYPELQLPVPDDLLLISESSTQYKQTRSIKFSNLSAAITGQGTPDFLTKWDSTGTKLEDSIVKEDVGTGYSSTKNIIVNGNITQTFPSGQFDISIGKNALASGLLGGENVAIGLDALTNLETGTNNVAVGSSTLSTITTRRNNIAIGKNAMGANIGVGGDNNIALGFNTLNIANVGSDNIVLGSTNLQNTTSTNISENTVIGRQAGNSNTITNSFIRNVLLGRQAGIDTNANQVLQSIFIGYGAGQKMTGGNVNNDIGIGTSAFFGTNGTFTSSGNNIAIGRGAQGENTVDTQSSIKIGSDSGQARSFATNVSTVSSNLGQPNKAFGSHSALIGGYNNIVESQAGFIGAGHGNTISTNATGGAIVGGFNNIINGTGSAGMALGSDLIVEGNNQVVVGRYNESKNNAKLIVGSGTSNAARKNAFEVLNSGQLRASFYGGSNFPSQGVYKFLVTNPGGNILELDTSEIEESELNVTNISRDIGTSYFTGPTPPLNIKFTRLAGGAGTIEVVINSSFPTNRLIKFISDGSFAANEGLLIRADSGGAGYNINGQLTKTVLGPYKTVQLWFDGSEYFVLYEN